MIESAHTRWPCRAVLLGCLLVFLWSSWAGAVTGNDWRAMSAPARTAYVTGVVDNFVDVGTAIRTLVPAEKRTASEKMVVAFEECISHTPRPPSQLVAIVDKYIKDNPANWHGRMSGLVFEALRCRETPAAAARKGE